MSEGYIRVPEDSTGKRLIAIVNTINGEPVYSEVVVVSDTFGNAITPLVVWIGKSKGRS